jgi:hypothetical protein
VGTAYREGSIGCDDARTAFDEDHSPRNLFDFTLDLRSSVVDFLVASFDDLGNLAIHVLGEARYVVCDGRVVVRLTSLAVVPDLGLYMVGKYLRASSWTRLLTAL